MPPGQDKLPEAKLAMIRQWIEGGLLENSGATAAPKKKKTLNLAVTSSTGKPEGPAAMPESLVPRTGRLYVACGGDCRTGGQSVGSAGGACPGNSRYCSTTRTAVNCWVSCRSPKGSPTRCGSAATVPSCWPAAGVAARPAVPCSMTCGPASGW